MPAEASPKPVPAAATAALNTSSKEDNAKEDNANDLPFTYHLEHLDIRLGLKIQSYANTSLNRWTKDDTWVGSDLRIGASSAIGRRLNFSYNVSYFFADKQDSIRGYANDLAQHNISLGLEVGYFINHRLEGYARVAPGASLMKIQIDYGSDLLRDNVWAFRSDQSLGIRFRLLGKDDGRIRSARFWVFAEGGYALATSSKVELSFDETDLPNASSVGVGKLQLNGANGSLGFGLTY